VTAADALIPTPEWMLGTPADKAEKEHMANLIYDASKDLPCTELLVQAIVKMRNALRKSSNRSRDGAAAAAQYSASEPNENEDIDSIMAALGYTRR
jgi:hypothetical protein